jgi:long-chain acyl-CoA synthetase
MVATNRPTNLVHLFANSVTSYPDHPIFGTKNSQGQYEWSTYREIGQRVDDLRAGLAAAGIGRGDAVGIIANNRTEWAIAAFATYGLGARFVPMYESELPRILQYVITDGDVKVLFVSRPEIMEKIKDLPVGSGALKKVVLIEGQGSGTMEEMEKIGRAKPVAAITPDSDDIAVIIYTSGTTGDPKGVLLSHGNLTTNYIAGIAAFPELLEGQNVSLSILPWAHSYGLTAELHAILHLGGSIGFIESVQTVVQDMALVRPTWLISVPRVFNRIYHGLWDKMNRQGGLARKLFVMGVEAAKAKREAGGNGKGSWLDEMKFKLADLIVFSKVRQKMGGRLRGSMSGSAAMNVEIANFFLDIGIPIFDCYGMTETSPAISMNASYACKLGSVGRAIDQVRIVIDQSVVEPGAKDGEIIVYGPNVMKGYHKKPDQTREVITPDGGMRTGDRGYLDQDGFLYISGRIKEQFKLENGKYVFPAALEEEIALVPWVTNVLIAGADRQVTTCLVYPDIALIKQFAKTHGLPQDVEALIHNPKLQEHIKAEILKVLEGRFAGYEIPKKFIFLTEGFTLDNGMLTQTMKPKRRVIMDRYRDRIEAAYA